MTSSLMEREGSSKKWEFRAISKAKIRRQSERGWSKIAKTEATSFMDDLKVILTLSYCHPGETVLQIFQGFFLRILPKVRTGLML